MRTDVIKEALARLVRQSPFQPFIVNLENGDRIVVEHPENIAFDPRTNGEHTSSRFYVVPGEISYFGSLEAVTNVVLRDTGTTISDSAT